MGNGLTFLHTSPYIMNMCNVTFQVPRLSTFVFKKSLEGKISPIIFVDKSLKGFGWNNVGPASKTLAQH